MFYSMRKCITGSLNLGTADRVAVWVDTIVTGVPVEKAVGDCGDIVRVGIRDTARAEIGVVPSA